MLFSLWIRRGQRSIRQTFRPAVCALEDRTVPTVLYRMLASPGALSGPVNHFQVIAPTNVQSGQAFTVTVEAEDASNRIVPGYHGIIHFTLGTLDSGALVPGSYTFGAGDHGVHTFLLTLSAAGNQTIRAADTQSISGSALTRVGPHSATATHFVILASPSVNAGVPTNVTVEALDAFNHVVNGYTGSVRFSSSDGSATLPASYTFMASDNGVHQFTVTFVTAGQQALSALDVANGSIMGSANVSVVPLVNTGQGNGMWWGPNWPGGGFWWW